ncbi:MAG: flagellar hook-associated protein 3, partial [Proteobacteria bacterium]
MRVTEKMNQAQVLNNIQKNRSELSNLQNQAATGKRITKPSDDPTAAAKILASRTEGKNLEQFDKGIVNAKSFLETTESTLAQLTESLVRAKELAIQGAN